MGWFWEEGQRPRGEPSSWEYRGAVKGDLLVLHCELSFSVVVEASIDVMVSGDRGA